jgi:hypothetical protein
LRDGDEEHVDMRLVCSVADCLENFLLHELQVFRGKRSRDAVMEVFLRAPAVRPHMPVYYLHPEELAIQKEIISSLQR